MMTALHCPFLSDGRIAGALSGVRQDGACVMEIRKGRTTGSFAW